MLPAYIVTVTPVPGTVAFNAVCSLNRDVRREGSRVGTWSQPMYVEPANMPVTTTVIYISNQSRFLSMKLPNNEDIPAKICAGNIKLPKLMLCKWT